MPIGTIFARSLSVALLLGSVALIADGLSRTREIRTVDADDLAEMLEMPPPFEEISDLQLTIDATFTGVVHRNGALYSAYDRSAPATRRPCPT